jgi:hypothetical protein
VKNPIFIIPFGVIYGVLILATFVSGGIQKVDYPEMCEKTYGIDYIVPARKLSCFLFSEV